MKKTAKNASAAQDKASKVRAAYKAILAHFKRTGGIQWESTIAEGAGMDISHVCIAARQLSDEGMLFPVDHKYIKTTGLMIFAYALTGQGRMALGF